MALQGLLFDLDGTLLDSNHFHVRAWRRALLESGFDVPESRIAPEIGKGGDKLIPSLLGDEDQPRDKKLEEDYGRLFLDLIKAEPVPIIPGARELARAARKRGIQTALATSSKEEFLSAVEDSCGWKFLADFDAVVTSSDVENSKPDPDVPAAAQKKLGLSPAQCALVGDTPYDAQSCRSAGLVCLGVASSGLGFTEDELREAGARRVWKNAQALLDDLDNAILTASPQKISLSAQVLEALMGQALETACEGVEAGEVPIGAVLADGEGRVFARAFNRMNATQNKTSHAEIECFAAAAGKVPLDARDLILVSTLEPCVMCTGAAMEAAVETVVFALEAPYDSGTQRVRAPRSPESQMPRIVGGVRRAQAREQFVSWLEANQDTDQAAFIEQLLEATR
jgi:HAD superfamily hydrolase (TIGR01509 family)